MSREKEIMMTFEKERLVDLIIYLIDDLDKEERIQFVSKYIDPKLALESIDMRSPENFLREVKKFCKDCLNGEYYVEPDYNDYWDSYNEDVFEQCEWAENFTEYFNLAIMYSRNRDYDGAFEALEQLLNCIHEADFNNEILGTDSPEDYIEVDWNDVFEQYYICLKNCVKESMTMANKAFETWLSFVGRCTEHFLNHVEDVELMEKVIREKMKEFDSWDLQHLCFDLLKQFYEKYNSQYDFVKLAESFIKYTPNFYVDVVKAYVHQKDWDKGIDTISTALSKVDVEEVKTYLKETLIECYEKLGKVEEAFNIAEKLLYEKPSYDYYKRARCLSEKINRLNVFINEAAKKISRMKDYSAQELLIKILSYEGLTEKLVKFIEEESAGYSRYNHLKYGARALVYRALKDEETVPENLKDFIENIELENIEGIVDMEKLSESINKREFHMIAAINILKEMVEFHIEAAQRTRYKKAAYYCSVIKDISTVLKQQQEFNTYYDNLIASNKRRTALRDEMQKRIGRI